MQNQAKRLPEAHRPTIASTGLRPDNLPLRERTGGDRHGARRRSDPEEDASDNDPLDDVEDAPLDELELPDEEDASADGGGTYPGLGANNWSSATTLPAAAGAGGANFGGGNAGLAIFTYTSPDGTCFL